jgi:hypothetical protein
VGRRNHLASLEVSRVSIPVPPTRTGCLGYLTGRSALKGSYYVATSRDRVSSLFPVPMPKRRRDPGAPDHKCFKVIAVPLLVTVSVITAEIPEYHSRTIGLKHALALSGSCRRDGCAGRSVSRGVSSMHGGRDQRTQHRRSDEELGAKGRTSILASYRI